MFKSAVCREKNLECSRSCIALGWFANVCHSRCQGILDDLRYNPTLHVGMIHVHMMVPIPTVATLHPMMHDRQLQSDFSEA